MTQTSNLATLIKFNFKYYLKPRFETKKDKRRYYILMGIIAASLLVPLVSLIVGIYSFIVSSQNIEATKGLLSSLFSASQIATLIFGLTTYLQVMYLSKDKEILATLPVRPSEIFISKLLTVTVMEGLISTVLVIPSTIVIAIALGSIGAPVGIAYYLLIPVAVITLPLLVILLISIIAFPAMKFYSFLKKHQTIGAILIVVLIVGIVMAIYIPLYTSMPSSSTTPPDGIPVDDSIPEEEASQQAINSTMDSIANIGGYMIHTKALVGAMFGENVGINLLIYFGITLGALAIGIGLSMLLYRSTLQSLDDNVSSSALAKKEYVESSVQRALIKRELSVVGRDMAKLINLLMSYVMGPAIIFVMLFIMKMNSGGAAEGDALSMNAFSLGFAFGYGVFMIGGSNVGASAGMSLEGKSFAILKTLPVRGVDIFKAKLLILDAGAMISILVSLIITMILVPGNIIDIIGYIICSVLTVGSLNAFALFRDLKHPKLEWTIIKDITKNNMSTLIPLAVAIPEAVLGIGLPIVFAIFIPNKYIASAITWSILVVGALIYYFVLRHGVFAKVDKQFEEVEA